jgi:hypothetical protein
MKSHCIGICLVLFALAACAQGTIGQSQTRRAPYSLENNGNVHDSGGDSGGDAGRREFGSATVALPA